MFDKLVYMQIITVFFKAILDSSPTRFSLLMESSWSQFPEPQANYLANLISIQNHDNASGKKIWISMESCKHIL